MADKPTEITENEYQVPTTDDNPPPLPRHYQPKPHAYTQKEVQFLDVYVNTLDVKEALKASGLTMRQLERNKFVMKELEHLQNIVQTKHRLKMSGAKHIAMMDKFEKAYDDVAGSDNKAAVGYSSTLAKMSEAAMRASGEFKEKQEERGVRMQVNINIGGRDQEAEITTIEVE